MLDINVVPHFNSDIYIKISLNELVVFAVSTLAQKSKEINTEDIVAACFLMFPKRFALRGYPSWPDASVVNKRWLDCRQRGFIVGSTARSFNLTPKGLELAARVEKILSGNRPVKSAHKSQKSMRTRADRFIKAIDQSDAYKLYLKKGPEANITEFDFRSLLFCTMESTYKTLRANLDQFKQYATFCERKDILNFLNFIEIRFKNYLTDKTDDNKVYKGGMFKQKA